MRRWLRRTNYRATNPSEAARYDVEPRREGVIWTAIIGIVAVLIAWNIAFGRGIDRGRELGSGVADVDAVRTYAQEMESWWAGVYGDGPSGGSLDYDSLPSWDVESWGIWPAPDAPQALSTLHRTVTLSLITAVQARERTETIGWLVGVAAAFCNPRSAVGYLVEDIEALQGWRTSGERCDAGQRWAGPYRVDRDTLEIGDYVVYCSTGYDRHGVEDFGSKFDVWTYDLERACEIDSSASQAFQQAEFTWSQTIARICSNRFALTWREALNACQ